MVACGHRVAPVPMPLSVYPYDVTLVGLDDRTLGHARSVGTLSHNVPLTRDSEVARAPRSTSPPFGNQRPNACMRVLVDLQGPPKGPPLPLSHTVLHAPPPLRVTTATREHEKCPTCQGLTTRIHTETALPSLRTRLSVRHARSSRRPHLLRSICAHVPGGMRDRPAERAMSSPSCCCTTAVA